MSAQHHHAPGPADALLRAAARARAARAAARVKGRGTLVLLAVVGLLVALAGKLVQLQVVEGATYRHLAESQHLVTQKLSAQRGHIRDARGRLLATSVKRWSVFADPQVVQDKEAVARRLSWALGVPYGTLRARLERGNRFAWCKRQVSDAEADAVREMKLRGVHLRAEHKRFYPQAPLAAQIVGLCDIDGRGIGGLEMKMDALLRGRPGRETVRCDGGRRILRFPDDEPDRRPFDGCDVYLTLDGYIQSIACEELGAAVERHKPETAAAVVLDVPTGDVLALVSWPSFDPQNPGDAPVRNQRCIPVTDSLEFGSVMKPIVAALALESGVVTPQTPFDCHNGLWRLGARTLHDAHEYGMLGVDEIIIHSSNIGIAQVALAMGARSLHDGLRRFGFGAPSGVALPGEVGGIVRPLSVWNEYSVVSVSFGQEIAVTALAMARAFSVFGTHGALLQPRIVRRVVHADTGRIVYEAGPPVAVGHPVSPPVAETVLEMLRRVVDEGTGRRGRLEDYPVAGKTGTSQLLRPDGRGYSDDRYMGTFIALAPAHAPRLVVLVCLKAPTEGGYYGGTVAAPAVKNIIRRTLRYLRVPPVAAADRPAGDAS
jgi:cell division protein FtsI (penicillin-binding protein 3)